MFRWSSDDVLILVLRLCAAVTGIIAVIIFIFMCKESFPILTNVGLFRFLTDESWHPKENLFGLGPMIIGSLYGMVGAILLAAPCGVFAAIFCHFYAPPMLARILRALLGLMAGIPSVVYGFWGLVVLVPIISAIEPPGASLLAAILILTVMILPTVALLADASLANVPVSYLRGAAALGLGRWGTIRGVVLPAAKSGLFTGIVLQMGRAIGETMAVLMVAGNIVQTPRSLFEPVRTLTANVALEMAYAMGLHRSALFLSGLILLLLVVLLVMVADSIGEIQYYG